MDEKESEQACNRIVSGLDRPDHETVLAIYKTLLYYQGKEDIEAMLRWAMK